MKKKHLVVGEIYAHKHTERAYLLVSMQVWRQRRTGWSRRIVGYEPSHPSTPMRSNSTVFGEDQIGRLVLIADTADELRHIDVPEVAESEYKPARHAEYSEALHLWEAELPEGVRLDLVNTAQFEGLYGKVVSKRDAENERVDALRTQAYEIRKAWIERYERVAKELHTRGLKYKHGSEKRIFPSEAFYVPRPASVEISIESLEELLGIKEEQ